MGKTMFSDIEEIGSLLDDTIEKSFVKKGRIERYEDSITKGLSHDPFQPIVMNEDQPYYNPYKALPDGSYLPHSVDYWEGQGKASEDYLTTQQFYDRYIPVSQARSRFENFARSFSSDLFKSGGSVPVGTVHTYRDGHKYQKTAEGQWKPMGEPSDRMRTWLNHPNPEYKRQANQEIERHGTQVTAIETMIKRKQAEAKSQKDMQHKMTSDIMGHVKEAMSKLYDGKMPKEVENHFQKVADAGKAKEKEGKEDPIETAKKVANDLADHRPRHHVDVKFSHNGKHYTHSFKDVPSKGHHDAIGQVMEGLRKKLPGAHVLSAQATKAENLKQGASK